MTYSARENSVSDGKPVELYEFTCGSVFNRYTSSAVDITKGNDVFKADYIYRDGIDQTEDFNKGGLSLKFSIENSFAKSLMGFSPDGVTTLTVYRFHYGDSEYIVYWKGRVLTAKATGNEISIECESVFSSLKRQGLRARYERSCRHSLYDSGCTLSMSSFVLVANVSGVADEFLDVPDASSRPDGYFTGGVAMDGDGNLRLITSHTGTTIRLNRAFNSSPGAKDISLYPGCDKAKLTCINKFNNLPNFGGFPYIPTINPFGGGSII